MTRFGVKFTFQYFFSYIYIFYIIFSIISIRTLNNNCKSHKIQYSRRSKSDNAGKKGLISDNENKNFSVIELISKEKNKKRLTPNNENKIFDKKNLFNIFFI